MQGENIPFSHKYAIRYYCFLIQQCIGLALAFWSHNMTLVMLFSIFHNVMAFLIPAKEPLDQKYAKQLNKSLAVMGPPIVSCLMTPVMLGIFWVHFDTLVGDSIANYLAAIISLVFLIGGSIDAAHELLHRPETFCKVICFFNLFFYQFTVYPIEHLYLHHKNVGTPLDPITSPKGMTIFQYYVNAISSAYKFNYKHSKNIFFMCLGATIFYNVGVLSLTLHEGSGLYKAAFFSLFSYFSLFLMEATEYIEHYGLIYRESGDSQALEICSWNTVHNEYLSWILFRFQKHSDHHMNAHKVYPVMELNEKMPCFPFDFGNAMLFAPVPQLWFYLADPLVDEVIKKQALPKNHLKSVEKAVFYQRALVTFLFLIVLAK